jgi:hypothetical protein
MHYFKFTKEDTSYYVATSQKDMHYSFVNAKTVIGINDSSGAILAFISPAFLEVLSIHLNAFHITPEEIDEKTFLTAINLL